MICESQNTIIEQSDFSCIGDIARHCDMNKLCVAINEAQIFDLNELLCDNFFDIIVEKKENESYRDLLCGCSWIDCNKKRRKHLGIKRVLVYFSYSRYLLINEFNDTPNGNVTKQNDFSLPKPFREVQAFSDKYRNMANDLFNDVHDYLCHNKELFEGFNSCNCKENCGCDLGNCNCGTTKNKGFSNSISFIR